MAAVNPRRFELFDLAFVLVSAAAFVMTGLTVWRQVITPTEVSASARAIKDKAPVKVQNWDHLVATGHRFGATNPKTTIVIFGDLQCPAGTEEFGRESTGAGGIGVGHQAHHLCSLAGSGDGR